MVLDFPLQWPLAKRVCAQCYVLCSVSKKIWHWANISFGEQKLAQTCRNATNAAFQAVKALCVTYTILNRNVASARDWDITAQMLWRYCTFAQLTGNIVCAHILGDTGFQWAPNLSARASVEKHWSVEGLWKMRFMLKFCRRLIKTSNFVIPIIIFPLRSCLRGRINRTKCRQQNKQDANLSSDNAHVHRRMRQDHVGQQPLMVRSGDEQIAVAWPCYVRSSLHLRRPKNFYNDRNNLS